MLILIESLAMCFILLIICVVGIAAKENGTFGSYENLGLAAIVIVSILFFNRSSNRYLRMSSIVIGLIIGFVVGRSVGRCAALCGFNIRNRSYICLLSIHEDSTTRWP